MKTKNKSTKLDNTDKKLIISDVIKSVCLSADNGFCLLGMKSNNECNFKGKCVHKQTVL